MQHFRIKPPKVFFPKYESPPRTPSQLARDAEALAEYKRKLAEAPTILPKGDYCPLVMKLIS